MKLNKFAYLYSKPLGNHTLKIMKKIPGNLLKNLEKSWKYHGILLVRKNGNPEECIPVGCVPSAAVAICWRGVCQGGCLPREGVSACGCLPDTPPLPLPPWTE